MDVDFWASRVHPAKQLVSVQASFLASDNHLVLNESEGDEEAIAFFSCPFCYVEIEVHLLCIHMQNEHCFDLKNAVCPLCAGNLGRDAIGHFVAQHTSSLQMRCPELSQRRRKPQKPGPWPNTSAALGKELSSFIWSSAKNGGNLNEPSSDPLVLPFLSTLPDSAPEEIRSDHTLSTNSLVSPDSKSSSPSFTNGTREQDYETRRQKAQFVQQLIGSTIFEDVSFGTEKFSKIA